jgi:hypothetical protein
MKNEIAVPVAVLCLCLCAAHPTGARADDAALPNHPPLLSADEDGVFVGGLPPGESRVWQERVFSDGAAGITTALCAEDLSLQPIFPAVAPARGAGVLCLADLTVLGPQELTATVYLSGRLTGSSRQLVVQPDCRIFVEEGSTPVPGTESDGGPLYRHVLACGSNGMARAAFGQFFTTDLVAGEASFVSGSFAFALEREFGQGGGCGCNPVECDPCCATCPD